MKLLGVIAAALALTATGSSTWVTFRTDGLRIRHPSNWSETARALTPVTSPKQVLAVASFAFPENPGANGCRPAGTLARKQPTGAVVFVIEYGADRPSAFPPRPAHFKLHAFANYECFGRSYQLRFREAGRYFQVFASFGRRVTPSTRNTVLRVLDSFIVQPR